RTRRKAWSQPSLTSSMERFGSFAGSPRIAGDIAVRAMKSLRKIQRGSAVYIGTDTVYGCDCSIACWPGQPRIAAEPPSDKFVIAEDRIFGSGGGTRPPALRIMIPLL